MTIVPRYAFPPGTEITLFERPMVIVGQDGQGYRVADLENFGVTSVLPFSRLVEQLKLSGARIDTDVPMTGGRLAERLGGYATAPCVFLRCNVLAGSGSSARGQYRTER